MRQILVVAMLLAACDKPPEAHPVLVPFRLHKGLVSTPCAETGLFDNISLRDRAKTKVAKGDDRDACVLPIDWRRERFLLHSLSCTREGTEPARVEVTMMGVDGSRVHGHEFDLDETPTQSITSGPGLPLMIDIEASGQGTANCTIVGMYVRTTDSAKLWGPYRIVSHEGTWEPNETR